MTNHEFLDFLESERWKRRLSKYKFYRELLGLSHGTIPWIRKGGTITPQTLQKIAEALGISATLTVTIGESKNKTQKDIK